MSSNSSGPASPFNADEAEQLAAQFRPVWDVEEATPAPEPVAEAAPVPAVPVAKATVRWAPGNGPEGFPAPAPPAPLPAPAPRKRREAPAPPEVRELTGDEKVPVSSDGAVAMAVVTGPVLPPKAADVAVPQEPSIVVKDIAATARAIADEETARKRSDEDRRRQTVRLDDLRKDPALADMYAKYDAPAAAPPAQPVPAPPSRRAAVAAPIPEVEEEIPPANNNRKIVLGAVGVAALIGLLGIARATLSDKDDSLPTPPGTTEAATRQTSSPGASPIGTAAPDSTAPREDTAAATAHADPPAKPTTTTPAPPAADPPAAPAKKDAPRKEDRPKEDPKPKAAPPPPQPPPPQQPPPQAADKKKPAGKGAGGIVRDVPF